MERLSLSCVVLVLDASSSILHPPPGLLGGMPCVHNNVQIPLLWELLLKSWCHRWKCGCGPLWGFAHTGGAARLCSHRGEVLWKKQVKWCHLSSLICERLAQANARSCWLVSSCEIYLLTVKELQKGVSIGVELLNWTIPSSEQVTCTEEMAHATCSQKATIVSREQRLPPRVYCSYCHIPSDKGTAFLKFFSFSILMHY